jgi:hypothetical protein
MTNIFLALMLKESSFNVNARFSHSLSPITSSGARDYQSSTAIQNMLKSGTKEQQDNEPEGRVALGLSQVMGWNLVRGASNSGNGRCLVEQYRPDLAPILCVNPGDSISAKLLGENNISNAIMAGLVVLESKFKAMKNVGGQWVIGVRSNGVSRNLVFPTRIFGAVAGYLGYSTGGDANGTTYLSYASEIVGGSAYATANGSSAPRVSSYKQQSATEGASGPTTSGGVGALPGCTASA